MTKGQLSVFLDFDDTIFSQELFYTWLDEYLLAHNVPHGTFKKSSDTFHEVKGPNIRLYDHKGHFKSLTGREWSYLSAEIEAALQKSRTDFCFPDAHDFLEKLTRNGYEPRILTYGDPAFQYFKINTCSVLHQLKIPKHVVTEPKASFLKREFQSTQGVLVDDKGPLHLPPHWTHVWLRRQKTVPIGRDGNVVYISSLFQFDEAMQYVKRNEEVG